MKGIYPLELMRNGLVINKRLETEQYVVWDAGKYCEVWRKLFPSALCVPTYEAYGSWAWTCGSYKRAKELVRELEGVVL